MRVLDTGVLMKSHVGVKETLVGGGWQRLVLFSTLQLEDGHQLPFEWYDILNVLTWEVSPTAINGACSQERMGRVASLAIKCAKSNKIPELHDVWLDTVYIGSRVKNLRKNYTQVQQGLFPCTHAPYQCENAKGNLK